MDLSVLILGGIAGIGYYLNREGRQERGAPVRRTSIEESHHPNTYHVYEDNRVPHVRTQQENLLKSLYKRAENPADTRVIPPFYNTFGNKKKDGVTAQTGTENGQGIIPELLSKEQLKQKPMISDINPARRALKKTPQEFGGFPVENFMNVGFHTNMIPYTKRRDVERFDDISDSRFESLSGIGSNIMVNKRDVPSFHKVVPQHHVTGHQFHGEDAQNRARLGASWKKNEERPFQPLQTAPDTTKAGRGGLTGNEGFHPMYQAKTYLTVDELRAKNNPKITYDLNGLQGAGKRFVSSGPSDIEERHYHPEREALLLHKYAVAGPAGQNAGQYRRPHQYPNVINNTRTTTDSEYYGPAVAEETGPHVRPQFQMLGGKFEQNNDYESGPAINNERRGYNLENEYRHRPTIKEQTHDSYLGSAVADYKSAGWYNMTDERPTIKEQTHEEHYNPATPGQSGSFTCREDQYNAEINALKEATHAPWLPNMEYAKNEASREANESVVRSRMGMNAREDPNIMNGIHHNVQQQNRNDSQCRVVPLQLKSSLRGSTKQMKQLQPEPAAVQQLFSNPFSNYQK